MPHMLGVPALEEGDPVPLLILLEPHDSSLYRISHHSALAASSSAPRTISFTVESMSSLESIQCR